MADGGVEKETVELVYPENLEVQEGIPCPSVEAWCVYLAPHGGSGFFEDFRPCICLLLVPAIEGLSTWTTGCVVDSACYAAFGLGSGIPVKAVAGR